MTDNRTECLKMIHEATQDMQYTPQELALLEQCETNCRNYLESVGVDLDDVDTCHNIVLTIDTIARTMYDMNAHWSVAMVSLVKLALRRAE